MRFKKIYIEITNMCNLNCNFCIKNKRKQKIMSLNEFKIILNKIKDYTNYIYLHILGEPLLLNNINDFINLANEKGFYVNITTNGYLINKIKNNDHIRQINISLHSFSEKNQKPMNLYLKDIYECVDFFSNNGTYISYRIWAKNKFNNAIIKNLESKYNKKIERNCKLKDNVFINFEKQFIWPDLKNRILNDNGKCYGLIDHIGILVDGTVIPCCLDSLGVIKLGNVFDEDLESILKKPKTLNIINGFNQNKKIETLCKHCNFLGRDD